MEGSTSSFSTKGKSESVVIVPIMERLTLSMGG